MKKIMVWNSKGGVGKTTTVINMGYGLAREGKNVLIVDLGFQNNISEWLDIKGEYKSIYDYMIGNFDTRLFNSGKLGMMNQSEFIIRISKNVYTLRLVNNTTEVAEIIKDGRMLGDIRMCLSKIFSKYDFDYIIFDSAPEVTEIHKYILDLTDEIFIPVNMEYSAVRGVIQVIELTRMLGMESKISKIIPTFVDRRLRRTKELLDIMGGYFGEKMTWGIKTCSKLSECNGFHKDIFTFSPYSTGAKDYERLAKEVVNN